MKPSGKENSMINQAPKGIYKIINELKYRLLASFSMFLLFFGIGFLFSNNIIHHLIKLFPFKNILFIQTSLSEALIISIKIAFLTGIIFSFPIIAYNIIRFNDSILPRRNVFQVCTTIIISYVSFFVGMLFAYNPIVTSLFFILYNYGAGIKSASIAYSLTNYINFCLDTIITTGFCFASLSAIIYGAKTRILNKFFVKTLFKYLFISILALFFLSAFINHLFKFILLLILVLLFYLISIFFCKLYEVI